MYEDLRFEVADHVGVLTLDRPDARNALRRQTYVELEDVVRTLGERDVRCLVITGADPAFCSGDDVKLIMAGPERPTAALASAPRLTPAADALLHTDVPVDRRRQRRGRRLGHGAGVDGRHPGGVRAGPLRRAVRAPRPRVRRPGLRPPRPARRPRARRRAAVHRRRRSTPPPPREIGLVSRVVAHDELLPAATELARPHRRQPAARRAVAEARAAPGARPRLERRSGRGCRPTSPGCSRPTTTARASPRSWRSARRRTAAWLSARRRPVPAPRCRPARRGR